MSTDPGPARDGADALAAAMRDAARRADDRLAVTIDDYALAPAGRLSDALRARLSRRIASAVAALAGALRHHAVKLLNGAAIALPDDAAILARLTKAGLFRDPALMNELTAAVRFSALADALPPGGDPRGSSLLIRLSDADDRLVAQAARALLIADSGDDDAGALPAALQHRMIWWTAAALGGDDDALDRALVEAALRSIAAADESDRPATLATRLALALDARPDELEPLLLAALADRRLALVAALLAQALKLGFDDIRAMLIEADGDRLWIALRAAGLGRSPIAQVALALADADPARDIDALADRLDAIAGIAVADARVALSPLSLHPEYRAARRRIERA